MYIDASVDWLRGIDHLIEGQIALVRQYRIGDMTTEDLIRSTELLSEAFGEASIAESVADSIGHDRARAYFRDLLHYIGDERREIRDVLV